MTPTELSPQQALALVRLQFLYLMRRPFRVRESFLDCLCSNLRALHFPGRLELALIAIAIKAFGAGPDSREELSCRALDAIDLWERADT
jgi:hypothetical protein